jgi:hypothetical protein
MLEASIAEVVVRREAVRRAGGLDRRADRRVPTKHVMSESVRQFLYEKYMYPCSALGPALDTELVVRREPVRQAGKPEPVGGHQQGNHPRFDSDEAGGGAAPTVRRLVAAAKLGLLALTLAFFADTVLLDQSGLVFGAQTDSFQFTAPSGGTLEIQLTDFVWPTALQDLTLSITSATNTLDTLLGPGHTSMTLDAGGTYYAHIMGHAGGQWNMGAFGLLATFSQQVAPVPLPAGATLLVGGVLAMLWSVRRRARRSHWGAGLDSIENAN